MPLTLIAQSVQRKLPMSNYLRLVARGAKHGLSSVEHFVKEIW